MEMIDVLQKLREIAETKPELVADAVDNVQRTNPTEAMDPKQQAAIAISKKEKMAEGGMKDYLHDEAEKMSRKEFIEKHGESLAGFWDSINGTEEATEGKIPAGLKAYQDKKAGKEMKKETVKESIQISADSPQEASMMMQLLKLAGVQTVDQAMINQEPEAGENPAHGEPGHSCGHDDDAMGSQDMGRMRDMMSAPAEEKAEETFANSMGDEKEEPKYQDTDTLVNTMSGGLNRQKKTYPKVASGDNPMAAEDKISEDELTNSLRAQYEGFKEAYHKKAKMDEAPKPDFLDMDKDGDKKEPMKKAIKDKEAK
jgi:hypothetical protein